MRALLAALALLWAMPLAAQLETTAEPAATPTPVQTIAATQDAGDDERIAERISGIFAELPAFAAVEVAVSEATSAELKDSLEKGDLDLAVMNTLGNLRDGFHVHPLYDERYVVIFPPEHRLARLNAVKLADLSNEPYVDRLSCEMRETVMEICRDNKINLYARFRSEREDWVQAMVLARIGFAFMPECSVTISEILQRPLVEPEVTRTISLVSMAGRPYSPATAAMVRAAKSFDWPG